jgi:hypothetical protein
VLCLRLNGAGKASIREERLRVLVSLKSNSISATRLNRINHPKKGRPFQAAYFIPSHYPTQAPGSLLNHPSG